LSTTLRKGPSKRPPEVMVEDGNRILGTMCVSAKDHARYIVDRAARFSAIARGSLVVSATVICVSGRTKSGDSPSVRARLRSKRRSEVCS
jgi:hypothetical protein